MSDRQLKLITTETAGSKITSTTTISNVNPTASGSDMLTFAKKLNAFTDNSYVKTNLVETTNIDTETVKSFAPVTLGDTASYNDDDVVLDVRLNGQPYLSDNCVGYALKIPETLNIYRILNDGNKGIAVMNLPTSLTSINVTLIIKETTEWYATVINKTVTITS